MISLDDLPTGDAPMPLPLPHFPAPFQAVIWRNWGRVSPARLAKVLFTDETTISASAREMGLPQIAVSPHWQCDGFLTLIRQNWHVLPYDQLLELLGWPPEKLLIALHEEDFLWIKMGSSKPAATPVRWRELSSDETKATAQLREIAQKYFSALGDIAPAQMPFDFAARLAQVPAIMPAPLAPKSDEETALNASWEIAIETPTPRLQQWAADFEEFLRKRWNIPLASQKPAAGKVLLRIIADHNAPRESHQIELAPTQITIEGVDERGVLRGLQWLKSTFTARGGPYFMPQQINRRTRFEQRIIHPFNASYGETLALPNHEIVPDGLLARLADCGVNGLWMQGILYQLQPWPKIPELNRNWETRVANLRRLSERAARYGIGIYLYLNEPRALPTGIWEAHPEIAHLRGVTAERAGTTALCTSVPKVREELREALANLFASVPELAGCFTISMSENLTHCHSRPVDEKCPRCSKRPVHEVVVEANRTIAEGVWQGNPRAEVINWTWAWGYGDPDAASLENWSQYAIEQLPQDIKIMCTSEEALPTRVGGIEGKVVDYSISQVGPGPRSRAMWRIAAANGHRTMAKVQFNNTWELSAVPYLPVFQLVQHHLNGLCDADVNGLLLSWTLGGYPSPTIAMAGQLFWEGDKSTFDDWWKRTFGESAATVRAACDKMSTAFREFPFHISSVYTAPYNYGPMNLLHAYPTGRNATMIGFPYDDLEHWRAIYPVDVYENQLHLVESGWRDGLQLLKEENNLPTSGALSDLRRVATASWIHLRSTLNQVKFVRRRDAFHAAQNEEREKLRTEILAILEDEIALAQQMALLQREDSRLGYEASNHYYYTANELGEKVLNCHGLKSTFERA